MQQELHIMIDIETLGTRANTVVGEVGWAVFETHANTVNYSGSWHLNMQEQVGKRSIHISTLVWWSEQAEEARRNLFSRNYVSVETFLNEFLNGISWHNIQGVWSHGLGFDVPILEDLHKQYGKVVPWHYRTPRDTRTLFWLTDLPKTEFVEPTLKHSAEADAIAQAMTVQRALKRLYHATNA